MISQNINLWTRLRRWISGAPVADTRRYKAARPSRLHKDWTRTNYSQNYTLRNDLYTLRARSREECQNNPLFKKYLSLCKSNIVGQSGPQLQVRARTVRGDKLMTKLNKQIENLWWEFCSAQNFSASGKLSFWDMLMLLAEAVPTDGEMLIQIVESNNKFGIAFKTFSADYLDENYNVGRGENGNRIIMSVEVNDDNRPVAYHLTTPSSNIMFAPKQERKRVRIPAEQIIFAGVPERDEESTRCVPWTATVLLKAKFLNELQNAVLVGAQMAANTVGLITQPTPDEGQAEYTGTDGEALSPLQLDTAPGSFNILDPGMDLKTFDPNIPTQNHAEHVKLVQAEIAAGLGINYFELTGDLGEVNFSSARIGLTASRDTWRERQNWLAESVCTPMYHAFIRAAFLNGLLKVDPREYQEIQRPMWRGRGWAYIEPLKDAQANAFAVATGQKTLTDVHAEQGVDIVDFIETAKNDQTLLAEAGLAFASGQEKATDSKDTEDEPDESAADEKKKKDKAKEV